MGAEAFTTGTHSVFSSPRPRLRVAAHEAVHQLQHGRTRDAFLGAEGHAEALAQAVERHRPVADLLGPHGAPVSPGTRRFVQLDDFSVKGARLPRALRSGLPLKAAENGEAITSVVDKKLLYATRDAVAEANARLDAQNAGVSLILKGPPLAAQKLHGVTLGRVQRVEPRFQGSRRGLLPEDCGEADRELSGPSGEDRPLRGVCAGRGPKSVTPVTNDPREMRAAVLQQAGLGDGQAALDSYSAMSADAADEFDAKYGVNQHAAPKIGQSYTIAEKATGADGWSFHWAFVILQLGDDRVTLENSALSATDSPPGARNKAWGFEMYGPASRTGQTYHETWEYPFGSREQGAMTLTAEPVADETLHLGLMEILAQIGGAQFSLDLVAAIQKLPATDQESVRALLQRMTRLNADGPRARAAQAFLDRLGVSP